MEIGENEEGAMCIGAPILDRTGRPIAALNASGPETRIGERTATALGEALLRAAAQISGALGQSRVARRKGPPRRRCRQRNAVGSAPVDA